MLPGFDKLCYSQQVTGDKSQATPDYTPRATLLASSCPRCRSPQVFHGRLQGNGPGLAVPKLPVLLERLKQAINLRVYIRSPGCKKLYYFKSVHSAIPVHWLYQFRIFAKQENDRVCRCSPTCFNIFVFDKLFGDECRHRPSRWGVSQDAKTMIDR